MATRKNLGLVIVAAVGLLAVSGAALADELHVPIPYGTIQAAVNASNNGDTIIVVPGTYYENLDLKSKDLTLISKDPNNPEATVIDGSKGTGPVIVCGSGCYSFNVSIRGFTITGGNGENYYYGGIQGYKYICGGAQPKFSISISDCIVVNNIGPGIHNFNRGAVGSISNCVVTNNRTTHVGGGICRVNVPITNCIIAYNVAEPWGGGGGGLGECDGEISNCLIVGNKATGNGSGFYNCGGTISNCTIVGNYAGSGGVLSFSKGTVSNCIIWANRPISPSTVLFSCVQGGGDGTGCISSDPCFVVPGCWDTNGTPEDISDDFWVDGDYHLRSESACINAGNYAYCMSVPSTDYEGGIRLVGGQIDMGCYEADSVADTDGDWLADSCEPGYADDPDRDDDGILDGLELLQGTDPNAYDSLRQWNIPADANTIQEALFFSRSGETIVVSEGVYPENIYIGGRNVLLTNTNPSDPNVVAATVVNGDTDANSQTHNGRVITFAGTEETTCQIRGPTIVGGCGDHSGGGIYGNGTLAGITYCTITNNSGSGLGYCNGLVSNCTISDNSARGVYNSSGSITNCIITGNSDGGLFRYSGLIANCTITSNTARYWAGGLEAYDSLITNCTISGNKAERYYGGGVQVRDSVITNCTITGNSACGNGGGIYCRGTVTIANSILWGNTAPYGPEIFFSGRSSWMPTLMVAYTNIQHGQAAVYVEGECELSWVANIDKDPCFVFPGYWDPNSAPADANDDFWIEGDYHLLPNSACIDAGDPNYEAEPNETDLDGNPRVIGGKIDMGAYESNYIEFPMKFTPQVLNPGSKGNWVKAHFVLPEGFNVNDVNVSSPAKLWPLGIESDYMNVFINEDDLVEIEVGFDRVAFCGVEIDNSPLEVIVIGKLTIGQDFYGTDTIRIIDKTLEFLAGLAAHWLEADCGKPDWCSGLDLNQDSAVNFVDFAISDGCCIEIVTQ